MINTALDFQVFVYLAELNQRKQQAGPPPEEQHAQQPKQQQQQQAPARVITVDSGENNDDERARTVDLNGFAQPEPRPQQNTGRNVIPCKVIKVA